MKVKALFLLVMLTTMVAAQGKKANLKKPPRSVLEAAIILTCPEKISMDAKPIGKWTGPGYSLPLLMATDKYTKPEHREAVCLYGRPECVFKVSQQWPDGTTCTVAEDKKSYICKPNQ